VVTNPVSHDFSSWASFYRKILHQSIDKISKSFGYIKNIKAFTLSSTRIGLSPMDNLIYFFIKKKSYPSQTTQHFAKGFFSKWRAKCWEFLVFAILIICIILSKNKNGVFQRVIYV
jgi:hypothetical protein